jgi:hypothetical protein
VVLSDKSSLSQTLNEERFSLQIIVALIGCCNAGDRKRTQFFLPLTDAILHSNAFENSEHNR